MHRISVRELIEFVYQTGDLKLTSVSSGRMLQGAEGHRKVQKNRDASWQNEVSVKYENVQQSGISLYGRIDGVLRAEDATIVEEIKTYIGSVTFAVFVLSDYIDDAYYSEHQRVLSEYQTKFKGLSFLHLAQALIYAYIYARANKLPEVICRLNYTKLNTSAEKFIDVLCSLEFLQVFFDYTWGVWHAQHERVNDIRNSCVQSLQAIQFPFTFRAEQRRLSVAVYKNITQGTNLFSRAPTGTGKTLATLFPALKALGHGKTDKVFYLTAKTPGRVVAENTLRLLQKNGADIRYCVISAKEKVCLKEFPLCDPEYCEYAVDYYDKQKDALQYAYNLKEWNYAQIRSMALEFMLCPFEFSLALSTYAEVVICDYNYCFDPIVFLRRHFEDLKVEYTFLIDEAHNLVDRAREMYSDELSSSEVMQWCSIFPKKYKKISGLLQDLYNELEAFYPQDKDFFTLPAFPQNIMTYVEEIIINTEVLLDKKNEPHVKYSMLKVYFRLVFVYACVRSITPDHIVYYQRDEASFTLKVFCINPRYLLAEYVKNAKCCVFFSATLHPFDYYCDILAGKETDSRLAFLSPFRREQFGLFVYNGINTYFKNRDQAYEPLAELVQHVCEVKTGNYIVYFPSFSFLTFVYDKLKEKTPANIICQKPNMNEEERSEFLSRFEETNETLIGLAILGGIFSEGIDLVGNKLIGAIIVTVGLPVLGGEKSLIQTYYDEKMHKGFEYAYRYPGFNKVMQAAGRVIRSETDKGFVILVDQRYTKREYKELYPADWQHFKIYTELQGLVEAVKGVMN